jgi:hypothetical protein
MCGCQVAAACPVVRAKSDHLNLHPALQVVQGQTTEVFKRYPEPARSSMSFSLLYHSGGSLRSLDLTCETPYEFDLWFKGIQVRAGPP